MLITWNYLKERYLDQKGQGMVEYAVILAFVVVVAASLANAGTLQTAISAVFTSVANLL
jgi:pilus assembly protein Flp/PilA